MQLFVLLAMLSLTNSALGQVIAHDLRVGSGAASQNLNSYGVAAAASPTTWSPGDWFGVGTVAAFPHPSGMPFSIADDSQTDISGGGTGTPFPADDQGIIDGTVDPNDRFFSFSDIVNASNPSGSATATWAFDISGSSSLSISIEMAAMGDFEAGDELLWSYSIDGAPFTTIFSSSINETGDQDYTMEDGDIVNLNDPMLINGTTLTDVFQNFTASVSGTGNVLTLRLEAAQDGGSEAFAARNILISGTAAASPVRISEFQPNPNGSDPATQPVELSGAAGTTFSGFLVSVESDGGGSMGTIDRVAAVSGTFDANGLLVVDIPDLENPSFTFLLTDGSTTPTTGTDIDTDNDGVADNVASLGNVLDAIGIPDNTPDQANLYGTDLGGGDFTYTGDEPRLVFRDASTGDWYAVNDPDNGEVFDITATDVTPAVFNTDPTTGSGTFGAINPTRGAAPTFDLQITEMWHGQDGADLTEDWFEITNNGSAAWVAGTDPDLYYDDESQDGNAADLIQNITRIDPGSSVIVVIGNAGDATDFINVWDPVVDLSAVEVGFTDGSGLGSGGDGATLWAGSPTSTTFVDFESYPDASANSGQSYDVGLSAFSTVGNASGAVATLATAGSSGNEPAIGSPAPARIVLQVTEMWPGQDGPDLTEDWFEITNVGGRDWVSGTDPDLYYDDESQDPADAELIQGLTRIDAGDSVIVVIGNAGDATDFISVWDPVVDLSVVEVGFTDGSGLGSGGDGATLWVGSPSGTTVASFEAYPDASANSGQSYDVGLSAFSTVGNASGAVATLATAGSSGTEPAIGSPAPARTPVVIPDLLLSEVHVTPTGAEFIEVFNRSATQTFDLSDVYLTDATFSSGGVFYYNIVTGTDAGGGGFNDFHARFPAGATIAPGEYQTVAIAGSDDFFAEFGQNPTYELYEDGTADAIPDMREALPGSINNQGGLSNGGEVAVLYHWDGTSDLVTDLDYAVWGDKNEAVDKSGVSIDGPDAGATTTTYQNEVAIATQEVVGTGSPAGGNSFSRSASMTEGTEATSGGNGFNGQDETSENLSVTWEECTPSPNAANCAPNLPPVIATSASQTENFDTNFAFTPITFTDPNGDPMTYSAEMDDYDGNALPAWLSFDASTGAFSGIVNDLEDVGIYRIAVTADDGRGGTTTGTFVLTINLPSLQPVLTRLSGFTSVNGSEIPAFDPTTNRMFITTGDFIDVVDVSNLASPTLVFSIAMTDLDPNTGGANSVAVNNGVVAVASENANKQDEGTVAFFNANTATNTPTVLNLVTVGALPDMLTFTPDGTKVVVANEGEPSDDYTNDPEGSVSIIDISGGIAGATVQTATFTAYNGQEAALLADGVHLTQFNGVSVAQDLEPEYITVSADNQTAFVALQESNAMAKVDLNTATVTDLYGLGFKNHRELENALDPSNRDSGIEIRGWPVLGMYQPDAIASFSFGGMTYIVSANEGDAREYDAPFVDETRIGDVTLDPTVFPDAATLQLDENLGRLKITNQRGDTDNDGDFDQLYSYGARSFSIWDENGNLVYDSEDNIGQFTALLTPNLFNANDADPAEFDNRSDDKGAEPEGIVLGEVSGRTLAFVGLERVGGIMAFDVTDPNAVRFLNYTPSPAGDVAPEGLAFIPAAQSPNGQPVLAVSNEDSNTLSIYTIDVPPAIIVDQNLNTFATTATGTASPSQSFTVEGVNLTNDVVLTAPAEFAISLSATGTFGTSLTIPQATANATVTTVFVQYNPASGTSHTGTLTASSTGANNVTLALDGVVTGAITPIATARGVTNGTVVTITGTLTASDQFAGPAYIQDATGGIAIFDAQLHADGLFDIGDSVIVRGERSAFRGEEQLVNLTLVTDLGAANQPVQPQVITLADLDDPQYSAELVRIASADFPQPGDLLFGESNYVLTDGSGNGEMRIDGDVTALVGNEQPASCEVTGVISKFQFNPSDPMLFQLKPRLQPDLPCAQPYQAPQPTTVCISENNSLEVVTWNVEWFGHPNNSPAGSDPNAEQIQIDSVLAILNTLNADLYAFQEIADLNALTNLVNQMPGYAFLASDAVSNPPVVQDDSQQLVFVYRTSVINPTETKALFRSIHPDYNGGTIPPELTGYPDPDPGRFFASGRLPYMMTADVTINGVTESWRFVNLHGRANSSSDAQLRYDMRRFDVTALDDTLRAQYAGEKIVILGDYNDDVDETVADITGTTTSYDAYTSNPAEYSIPTIALSNAGFRSFTGRENMIDHIGVTNELFGNVITNSERVHYEVYDNDYNVTASDHLPVSLRMEVQAVPACNLSVSATSSNSIELSWDDVSGIETGYVLTFSDDGGTTFQPVPGSPLAPNTTTFTHTGLSASTTYIYVLQTVASPSNTSATVTITVTTGPAAGGGGALVAPTPPTDLTATGLNTRVIRLDWTDLATNELRYDIYRAPVTARTLNKIGEIPAGSGEMVYFDSAGLEADTRYSYQVIAVGSLLSGRSNTADGATYPFAPQVVSTTTGCAGGTAQAIVSGDQASEQFLWYTDSAGTNQITNFDGTAFTGNTLEVSRMAGTYTFYVSTVGVKYESTPLTPVSLTFNPIPEAVILDTLGGQSGRSCDETVTLIAQEVPNATYTWTVNGNFIGTGRTITGTVEGDYRVTVTLNGCSATSAAVSVNLNYAPPVRLNVSDNVSFCESGEIAVNEIPGAIYGWTRNGNNLGVTTPVLTVTESGEYRAIVTVDGCPAESVGVNVTIDNPTPNQPIELTAEATELCPGERTTLSVTPISGATYQWFRNGNLIETSENTTLETGVPGRYAVSAQLPGVCGTTVSSDALSLEVFETPDARLKRDADNAETLVIEILGTATVQNIVWTFNGEEVAQFAGQQTITPTEEGTYLAFVTYTTGCTVFTNGFRYFEANEPGDGGLPTGTDEENTELTLYPNPTTGAFLLQLPSGWTGETTVELTDNLGRVLETQTFGESQKTVRLSLKDYAAGTYFVRLQTAAGSFVRKVVRR